MHARWLTALTVTVLALGACARADAPLATLPAVTAVRPGSLALVAGEHASRLASIGEAVIGAAGGTVSTGGHTLVVPAGAVSAPTKFVIVPSDEGVLAVDLHAYQQDGNGAYAVDVGALGFAEPVTLVLGYAGAEPGITPSELVIVHLAQGTLTGKLDALPTTLDAEARTVSAPLEHFSGYAIATGG